MNCNVTMTCSLSLDSEVVKDIWVYFRFRNANAVRTVTAQCEPKKQDRSANYNWEVYRDDNFDCNLEIPQFGSDDVGEYECGIVDVSYTNTVNNVARSETRNLLVVDDETPINEESQGSNLRQIIGSTVGGAVGLLLMITLVMGLLKIWRAKASKARQQFCMHTNYIVFSCFMNKETIFVHICRESIWTYSGTKWRR